MIRELALWWSQQMLELLPDRLVRRDDTPAAALIATDCRDATGRSVLELTLRRARTETVVGRFTLDDAGIRLARAALASRHLPRTIVFRPREECLLEQNVVLPLAAEQELARVLRFEMDRWTPFTAAELFWTWSVERRDRRRARLDVHLYMVPRAAVREATDALQRMAASPTVLQASPSDGSLRSIGLGDADGRSDRLRRRMLTAAAGLCACLGVIAVALPIVRQSLARSEVDARIEALKPRVAVAEALRQRVLRETSGTDALARSRARGRDVLRILATITDALPDDTYLLGLVLNPETLRIDGRSAGAARLITALTASPMLHNPRFAAPVMRNDDGIDVFSIQADIGP